MTLPTLILIIIGWLVAGWCVAGLSMRYTNDADDCEVFTLLVWPLYVLWFLCCYFKKGKIPKMWKSFKHWLFKPWKRKDK